jgi:hypothetical protein
LRQPIIQNRPVARTCLSPDLPQGLYRASGQEDLSSIQYLQTTLQSPATRRHPRAEFHRT